MARPSRPRLRWLAALAAFVLLAVACGGGGGGGDTSADDAPEPRSPVQDLRVAVGEDPFLAGNPPNLDIGIRTNGPNPGIFETLTNISASYGPEAALALRWESSPQAAPTSWKFFLRPNVTFHNGTPLTAEAVVANLDTIARRRTHPRGLEPGTAKANGPTEVDIDLTLPNGRLAEQLAGPSMAIVAPGTRPGAGDTPDTTPTGTGPFAFASYTKGTELKLKANDKYWRGTPQLKSLTFRFGKETDASRLLATRQVEMVGMVPYKALASVSGRTDRVVQSRAGVATYLLLNSGGVDEWSTLKDDNLRKALAQAVDRRGVMKAAWEDHGDDDDSLIPELVLGSDAASRVRPPSFNLADAKKSLDAAGWTAGSDGTRSKDGKPLVLNLLLSRPTDQGDAAATLKTQLAQVGIALQIQDPGADSPFTKVNQSQFDLYLDSRPQDDANPCSLCRFFSFKPGADLTFAGSAYAGPKADDLFERAYTASAIDTARRTAADLMQVVTAEKISAISLGALKTEWLVSPRVRGFEPAVLPGSQRWDSVFLTV